MKNCCIEHLKMNRAKGRSVLRLDPTRTTTIRLAFEREATKRFLRIKKAILQAVGRDDVLSLARPKILAAPSKSDFVFASSKKKIRNFSNWLKEMVDENVLEASYTKTGRKIVGSKSWANTYIDASFKKGLRRAATEVMKKDPYLYNPQTGQRVPRPPTDINAAFLQPVHADKVGLIYARTYSDLEGISAGMDNKISRTLAQGIAEGRGPMDMAREMVREVDMTITRARTIARTEVIRAHHVGTINMYREAGVEGVSVLAEWSTAGFDVCPDCADLQGRVFNLEEIEPLIPLHPNCRCTAVPFIPGETFSEPYDEGSIGQQYLTKSGGFKTRGLFYKRGGTKKPPRIEGE